MNSLLKISEVATALRCSKSYAYFLVQSGALDSVFVGRKRLVPSSALEQAIKTGLPHANIGQCRDQHGV